MIEDGRLVRPFETASLNPGVAKMVETLPAKEQHSADCRHRSTLVGGEEPEGLEIPARQLPRGGKALGSGSEVERFRIERRHRSFIEGLTAGEALHLGDEMRICPVVGGALANVSADLEICSRNYSEIYSEEV